MMVENGGAFVESSRVPRIAELEQVVVKVVAELVAKRAQKCAIRCDFFLSRSSHPQPYEHRCGVVVAEEFSHPFAALKRSRFEHPDAALWDLIEARGFRKELRTSNSNLCCLARLHGCFNAFRNLWQQSCVRWQVERVDAVALKIMCPVFVLGRCVSKHD